MCVLPGDLEHQLLSSARNIGNLTELGELIIKNWEVMHSIILPDQKVATNVDFINFNSFATDRRDSLLTCVCTISIGTTEFSLPSPPGKQVGDVLGALPFSKIIYIYSEQRWKRKDNLAFPGTPYCWTNNAIFSLDLHLDHWPVLEKRIQVNRSIGPIAGKVIYDIS